MTGSERPLRVTWLGHGAERTGPPIYLLRILEGLQAHPEIEPSVVLLDDGPLLGDLQALAPTTVVKRQALTGIRRAATAGLSRVGATRSAATLADRRPRTGGTEPDVVVVNTAGSIAALPALDAPPRRLVSHVHELATGLDYWLDPELRRQVLEDSDELWVVADAVGRHLVEDHGVDPARLRTHRGVLPSDAFDELDPAERERRRGELGVGPAEVLVGASGTLDWRKASDHFLEVAQRSLEASPVPLHLVWIGGDPATPWGRLLLERSAAAGLEGRVHLIPEGDRPDRWFGALDLFLLPSREDAYPLVCMEAAAKHVPLVTFDSGGAGELIRDGGGVVVPYPDARALAAEVVRFASDPAARRAAGADARAAAERHTIDAALPSLIADLQRVAAS